MSRVLRRPMFRGGIANSEGTGITSGLDTPKRGLVDGPGGYAGYESTYEDFYSPTADFYKMMNATPVKSDTSEENKSFLSFAAINPETGLPYTQRDRLKLKPTIDEIAAKEGVVFKGTAAEKIKQQQEFLKQQEQKKLEEQKKSTPPPPSPPPLEKEEVSSKQDFKTIYEDLLPIFKASVGPDQDEYTRQKYLELAKFGLNLLKPTPAGVQSNLLSSVAAAAEKPLEGYGAILERERQAAKVPEALALQQAMKLSEPGTVGKAIRDLVQTGAAKNEKEALKIYLKSDSAAQRAETMKEKQLIRSDLQGYEGLKGVKDQAIINQLADLVYEDPGLAYKIKGDRSKYKPEALEEGAIYIDKGKIVKYKGGQFYRVNEPGFKG